MRCYSGKVVKNGGKRQGYKISVVNYAGCSSRKGMFISAGHQNKGLLKRVLYKFKKAGKKNKRNSKLFKKAGLLLLNHENSHL